MAVVPGLCWERAAGAAVLTCQLSIFLLAGPLLLAWVLVLASSWAPFLAYLAWWLWDLPTANSGGRSAGRLWNLIKLQSYDIWIMIVVCWWFVYLAGRRGPWVEWCRGWRVWRWAAGYFPITLVILHLHLHLQLFKPAQGEDGGAAPTPVLPDRLPPPRRPLLRRLLLLPH